MKCPEFQMLHERVVDITASPMVHISGDGLWEDLPEQEAHFRVMHELAQVYEQYFLLCIQLDLVRMNPRLTPGHNSNTRFLLEILLMSINENTLDHMFECRNTMLL
uniref:Uncharacterized protein n=1 Tax=Cacopsylla melanoneura TaxID=428564 RepID=A0A8D8SL87_9HEMI